MIDKAEPQTFVCFNCRDRGVILTEKTSKHGHICMFSSPCTYCQFGDHAQAGFNAIKQSRAASPARIQNRIHTTDWHEPSENR